MKDVQVIGKVARRRPMNQYGIRWDEDLEALVADLWNKGVRSSKIREILGDREFICSHAALMGKVYRLRRDRIYPMKRRLNEIMALSKTPKRNRPQNRRKRDDGIKNRVVHVRQAPHAPHAPHAPVQGVLPEVVVAKVPKSIENKAFSSRTGKVRKLNFKIAGNNIGLFSGDFFDAAK